MRTDGIELASVPMDPVWLPVFLLLLTALAAAISGISLFRSGQRTKALKTWGIGLACAALVLLSSRLTFRTPAPKLLPAHEESTSIVLGGVVLRMEAAPRYVFTVDGLEFLSLRVQGSALRASGVVGADDRALAQLSDNTFPVRRGMDLLPGKDDHSIWVAERGRKIFEVELDDPRTIEITGEFFGSMQDRAPLISCREGVRWAGGELSPGAVVDLRGRTGERVDFDRSGSVRVLD